MDGDETHDESSANAGSRRIRPLGAMVRVVCEQGRWTVLLNVASWEADRTQWAGSWPVINNWKRIHDYAT
ncbi:MAG: hypothetical protein KDA61_20640, partial [Planctomycetales bacterium]|nr:hypothetical protein [Planctomycetales bacterium]